jgi:hypothetical protein
VSGSIENVRAGDRKGQGDWAKPENELLRFHNLPRLDNKCGDLRCVKCGFGLVTLFAEPQQDLFLLLLVSVLRAIGGGFAPHISLFGLRTLDSATKVVVALLSLTGRRLVGAAHEHQ